MSSKERRTLREMIEEANAAIRAVTAEEAIDLSQRDDHLLIDLRDIRELARDGRIEGAFHCPRGMLEFWLEPGSPYFKEEFSVPGRSYVFFCAGGMRSALATKSALDMGLEPVMHIEGGYGAWVASGGQVLREGR